MMRDFLHGHGVQRDMTIRGGPYSWSKKGTVEGILRNLFFWMYRDSYIPPKNARTFWYRPPSKMQLQLQPHPASRLWNLEYERKIFVARWKIDFSFINGKWEGKIEVLTVVVSLIKWWRGWPILMIPTYECHIRVDAECLSSMFIH